MQACKKDTDMTLRSILLLFLLIFSPQSAFSEGFGGIEGLPQQTFLDPKDAFKAVAKVEDGQIKTAIILGDKIHAYIKDLHYTITKPKAFELTIQKPDPVTIEGDENAVFYGTQTIDVPLKHSEIMGSAVILPLPFTWQAAPMRGSATTLRPAPSTSTCRRQKN